MPPLAPPPPLAPRPDAAARARRRAVRRGEAAPGASRPRPRRRAHLDPRHLVRGGVGRSRNCRGGSVAAEERGGGGVASARCRVERRVAVARAQREARAAALEQQADGGVVAARRREVERGAALVVHAVDVEVGVLQQRAQDRRRLVAHRPVERRVALAVAAVDVDARRREQRAHRGLVLAPHRRVEPAAVGQPLLLLRVRGRDARRGRAQRLRADRRGAEDGGAAEVLRHDGWRRLAADWRLLVCCSRRQWRAALRRRCCSWRLFVRLPELAAEDLDRRARKQLLETHEIACQRRTREFAQLGQHEIVAQNRSWGATNFLADRSAS